jgi:hypothetical protein
MNNDRHEEFEEFKGFREFELLGSHFEGNPSPAAHELTDLPS